jgi:hypothetical protein
MALKSRSIARRSVGLIGAFSFDLPSAEPHGSVEMIAAAI